jgi:hypothetical protein
VTISGPIQPRRDDGSTVDATFELSSMIVYELVFHHKAGARGSVWSVNADYHEGLELLIQRLGSVGATILGISVDSGVAQKLDPADRELDIGFPVHVHTATDPHALRLDITRAARSVARRPTAKPGGGNDQKRLRITLVLDSSMDSDSLNRLLIG